MEIEEEGTLKRLERDGQEAEEGFARVIEKEVALVAENVPPDDDVTDRVGKIEYWLMDE